MAYIIQNDVGLNVLTESPAAILNRVTHGLFVFGRPIQPQAGQWYFTGQQVRGQHDGMHVVALVTADPVTGHVANIILDSFDFAQSLGSMLTSHERN